jgi:hypothetical protein
MAISKFILINKNDNVLVCCQAVKTGELIMFDGHEIQITANIDVGHKIAKTPLIKGSKVIRYGVPIGSSITDVAIGEHVHIHNMKSDYIPSHTRQSKVGK